MIGVSNHCLKTQFNRLHRPRYISKSISVAACGLGEKGLVLSMTFQMIDKAVGCSYARTMMDIINICGANRVYIIFIIFETTVRKTARDGRKWSIIL